MGALRKKKVHPSGEEQVRPSRTNGWTLPPHPLQLLAWTFLLFFGITFFVFMVPCIPNPVLRWFTVASYTVILLTHFVIHLLSVSCNPADDAVLAKLSKKSSRKPRSFDRSKHSHVIENQFCYICEVTVGSKSKHCSVCNKCVVDFDQ